MEQKQHHLPHDHGQALGRVLEQMPDDMHFLEAAAIFQQLCDGSRLRILWLLCHCEECGINIASAVGMSAAAVSHHLKTLKLHGLITSRRAGKEVYYTLADTDKAQLIHRMVDDFFQMTCPGKGLANHNGDEHHE
ncbi:metalloregulator ArsR/SmtB family transcription factor [Ruminococcaceae bacterium OttesenSCG-928-L11]|nr:metalloregulator ArsR/SmtB family transcription factor [Ruminococcaceae bacterium OttesenSCG-928-L11]